MDTESTHSLEGVIVTGRKWKMYESLLAVKPELFKGEKVLNFGSGISNIQKELVAKVTDCQIVNVDLRVDETVASNNLFALGPMMAIDMYLDIANPKSDTRKKIVDFKRKLLGTDGSVLVQADGKSLPFKNGEFDHVLALWSTYQIPTQFKETLYSELMRVGNTLHIGPIFKDDYNIILKLANEQDCEVVMCQPFGDIEKKVAPFQSSYDYDVYINLYNINKRIIAPVRDSVKVSKLFDIPLSASDNGSSTIVLRRK